MARTVVDNARVPFAPKTGANHRRFPLSAIRSALRKADGVARTAAVFLGCTSTSVNRWLKQHESLRAAQARAVADKAERDRVETDQLHDYSFQGLRKLVANAMRKIKDGESRQEPVVKGGKVVGHRDVPWKLTSAERQAMFLALTGTRGGREKFGTTIELTGKGGEPLPAQQTVNVLVDPKTMSEMVGRAFGARVAPRVLPEVAEPEQVAAE